MKELKKDIIKYLIIFVSAVFITFLFSFFIMPVTGDEIWCYGFSYNIYKGMIPYYDFSLLQTPLYFFLCSFFIKIFGEYLFSIHILNSILIGLIVLILFKRLGLKSLLLFPLFLLVLMPTYNYCCLFLLFVITFLLNMKRDNDLIIGIIVGIMFLIKQNIGIVMLVPLLFYSKKKIKSICCFIIPSLIFLIYLIYNNALYEFIDYCFLGMLEFGGNNTVISIFTCIWILQVIYIIIVLFKKKFRDKELFYIFMLQAISYPIFDLYHWYLSFIPFFYYYFKEFNYSDFKLNVKNYLKLIFIIIVFMFAIFIDIFYLTDERQIAKEANNYFYLRNVNNIGYDNLREYTNNVQNYLNDYEKIYFVSGNSYMVKLYMNLEINKFDLILDGNMGYNGEFRYVKEIDKICSENSCVFFVEDIDFDNEYCQVSKVIYDYVINKYKLIESYKYFAVYSN